MSTCGTCGTVFQSDLCPRCLATFVTHPFADEPVPATGETIAGCEVVEVVGQGALGIVYKARDPVTGQHVAVKLLAPDVAHDPRVRKRLAREGRALLRLSHPNIVRVHSMGVDLVAAILQQSRTGVPSQMASPGDPLGEAYFIRMDFVEGGSLRRRLRDGALPPGEALSIMGQILDGLQYAHEHGIIHRDVKPENVLLDLAGAVQLVDFGLAKFTAPPSPPSAPAAGARGESAIVSQKEISAVLSTAPSDLLGTPPYTAPEQRENPRDVDERADLYSAGVVFQEMLTGLRPPGPPPEPPLDRIVARMLEPERRLRYSSAQEVRTDLAKVCPTV